MKALILTTANLNSMTAGAGLIKALTTGCYLWGDESTMKTDIINVKGYYTPDGSYHPVDKGKISIGKNVKTSLDSEPTTPTDPVDPPPPTNDGDFPAYIPVGALWQMRFDLGDGNWTEYYTFKRIA
jgi:hypothetical protein